MQDGIPEGLGDRGRPGRSGSHKGWVDLTRLGISGTVHFVPCSDVFERMVKKSSMRPVKFIMELKVITVSLVKTTPK